MQVNDYIKFIITIVAYIICSYEVLINAVKSIFTEFSLDENVLMTVASIAAFIIGETHEAIAIIIFYQIGEMFEDFSMDKSRNSIRLLVDMKSDFANIYIDGKIEKVDVNEIKIGDILLVNPYEKVPVDGIVLFGATSLNTSALTGESIPRYV